MQRPDACVDKHHTYQRSKHHGRTYYAVDYPDSTFIKTRPQLAHHISDEEPPKHGTAKDGEITDELHEERLLGQHEVERCEQAEEQQYYSRVGQGYEKAGNTILQQTALVTAHIAFVFYGVGAESMQTEKEHYGCTYYLNPEQCRLVVYYLIKER